MQISDVLLSLSSKTNAGDRLGLGEIERKENLSR